MTVNMLNGLITDVVNMFIWNISSLSFIEFNCGVYMRMVWVNTKKHNKTRCVHLCSTHKERVILTRGSQRSRCFLTTTNSVQQNNLNYGTIPFNDSMAFNFYFILLYHACSRWTQTYPFMITVIEFLANVLGHLAVSLNFLYIWSTVGLLTGFQLHG